MLTGVSSRRHADGKQSILKIRCTVKGASWRVVIVRSVKRDLSVLIFRRSLLDLSLVVLTEPCLSDSNLPLWFIIHKCWSRQDVHRLPGVLWCTHFYPKSPAVLISLQAASSTLLLFSPSLHHAPLTELSEVSFQHLSPHTGPTAYRRGYCIPEEAAGVMLNFPGCW